MQPNTRACVAYIAGCLVAGRTAPSVFDRSQAKAILISGTVTRRKVEIYDHDRRCYFTGTPSQNTLHL